MRRWWVAIALVGFALFWMQSRRAAPPPRDEQEESEVQVRAETPWSKSTPASRDTPSSAATPLQSRPPQPAVATPNPYHVDRFTLRKLDLPQPTSVAELLKNLTEFKEPVLPEVMPAPDDAFDGDVLTMFRGYYEAEQGALRKIQVLRYTRAIEVVLQEPGKKPEMWSDVNGQLGKKNFKGDPYSLVLSLPDRRTIYLKFHSRIPVPKVDDPVRALTGWLISDKGSFRLALIDAGGREDREVIWPERESVVPILPAPLPR
jgi:hypothetical protein